MNRKKIISFVGIFSIALFYLNCSQMEFSNMSLDTLRGFIHNDLKNNHDGYIVPESNFKLNLSK